MSTLRIAEQDERALLWLEDPFVGRNRDRIREVYPVEQRPVAIRES